MAPCDAELHKDVGEGPADRGERRRRRRVDLGCCLVLVMAHVFLVHAISGGGRAIFYDTLRDSGYAENIRAGRIWSDPVFPGYAWWYPPGNAGLAAMVAKWWDVAAVEVYSASRWVINALLPVLIYIVGRSHRDWLTGLLAAVAVIGGSCWWFTYWWAPMPSIQGVVLNLVVLLVWQGRGTGTQTAGDIPEHCSQSSGTRGHRGEIRCSQNRGAASRATWNRGVRMVVVGVLLAASVWHHPLCALVAAGAMTLDAVQRASVAPRGGRWRELWPLGVVGVTTGLLAAPVWWHLLTMARENVAPLRYYSMSLFDPRYWGYAHNFVMWPLGLVGVVLVSRQRRGATWLVGYWAVGLVGQLPGYLHRTYGLAVPYVVPHEFQWHSQLAFGVLAAMGLRELLAGARRGRRRRWAARGAVAVCAASFAVSFWMLPYGLAHAYPVERMLRQYAPLTRMIRSETALDDVFLAHPEVSLRVVHGLTGRKCVAVPRGHANPAVDARRRVADAERALAGEDAAELAGVLRRYSVDYVLLVRRNATEYAAQRERMAGRAALLRPVFEDDEAGVVLYAVVGAAAAGEE